MSSSNSASSSQPPLVHHFELGDGMQLQVNVSGASNGYCAKIDFQLRNCSRQFILHWGGIYQGQTNWILPSDCPPGTRLYNQTALQTPFAKRGDTYMITLQLTEPKLHAIEFVLKDERYNRWLEDYEDALKELQSQLSRGMSLDKLQSNLFGPKIIRDIPIEGPTVDQQQSSFIYNKRHDVSQWLTKRTEWHKEGTNLNSTALLGLVEKSMIGDDVIMRRTFHTGKNDVVVLLKVVGGNYHVLVATNLKGATVLHWGVSKQSASEWLVSQAPPLEILPERSKLLDGACQTYFQETSSGDAVFQLQTADGFALKQSSSKDGKGAGDAKGTAKWLLDEIGQREKDAERSLMHRFDIATELIGRCRSEGELGIIGVLVWLRFMACRQLTWNKNYNVKPREISAAQDKLTDLLQRVYTEDPSCREIVRLIMACIGRGGEGDVGQRIRDEILVLQRNNACKGGMMEEWHQKLHNNTSPDDVIICQALLDYIRSDFNIDVYWRTLNANGLTKAILASYDRPIVSEPCFRAGTKEGLIRDLTSYLRTLKL
ncbi:hypothetical protein ACLOJK_003146 [Asimina triloba]